MSTPTDALNVVSNAVDEADQDPNAAAQEEVRREWDEYQVARAFDFNARRQYLRDRRWVSGTADVSYAVDSNLLGSYVDILVSYIYARNPKVSIRPAQQVEIKYDPPLNPADAASIIKRYQDQEVRRKANAERQAFAKTLQIVVSRLWDEGKLKKCMKKVVRSGFSVGVGWFKASLLFDSKTDPIIQTQINDLRDNLARIAALEAQIQYDTDRPTEDLQTELKRHMQGLQGQVEVILRKHLAIDFISAEHMQVSLDVRDTDDYLEAGWLSNDIYRTFEEAKALFPECSEEDWKQASAWYQRQPPNLQRLSSLGEGDALDIDPKGDATAQYTKSTDNADPSLYACGTDGKPVRFVKIVEKWDHRSNLIKTMVEGMKRWPKEPFSPRFGTTRFYPYFQVVFFPVDGDRHPQSLSWRLSKLQDEFANTRSNFRLTRQRSIPGIIVNAAQVDPENATKLRDGSQAEYILINLTEPERPIGDAFTEKPLPKIDPALFDTSMIIGDMEKISGVQEALQTSQTVEKTATQAEIEQGGFAARTTAQRDSVEDTLTDFARYTSELALQGFSGKEVETMAGALAFWPEDLPLEAITQMLQVDIEAGSTGRPNTSAEREAWVQILPLIERTIQQVLAARASNNEPIAQVYIELLRETLTRFDDRIDVDRFIPVMPPVLPVGGMAPGAAPGGAPGTPGGDAQPPGSPPGASPGAPSDQVTGPPGAPGATDPLPAAA